MYVYFDHGIEVDKFQEVHQLTETFIYLVYHFTHWVYIDLEELWVVSEKSNIHAVPRIYNIVANMPSNVVHILPAVHAPTGCDPTSKVSTKLPGVNAATKYMAILGNPK